MSLVCRLRSDDAEISMAAPSLFLTVALPSNFRSAAFAAVQFGMAIGSTGNKATSVVAFQICSMGVTRQVVFKLNANLAGLLGICVRVIGKKYRAYFAPNFGQLKQIFTEN